MKPVPKPMLARLASGPFDEPGWVYEEKYDGNRALERPRGGDLVVDGEIVALGLRGASPR